MVTHREGIRLAAPVHAEHNRNQQVYHQHRQYKFTDYTTAPGVILYVFLFVPEVLSDLARHKSPVFLLLIRLPRRDRKSTRLNSSHVRISYAVFCLKKKKKYKCLLQDYVV